jgi:hypothetical protein
MFKFIVLVALFSFVLCDPYVRFVNQIEGSTLSIYSDKLPTLKLSFTDATQYYSIPTGSLSITNVLEKSGDSLINGNSILLSFSAYGTVALVNSTTGVFTLVMLNESSATPMTDTTKAYIRMIDLGQAVEYVSFAYVAGSISSYTGYLVATSFEAVDPSVATEFRIFESTQGSYNAPLITAPLTLSAGNAYTLFFYTSSGSYTAKLAYDHSISGSVTPVSSTSSSTGSPTPVPSSTSSSGNTQTPLTTSQIINNQGTETETNASNKVSIGIFSVIALLCSVFLL